MSNNYARKVTTMSKTKSYPAVTRDFGPPITHELPPDYPDPYYEIDEEDTKLKTDVKTSRSEILANALANAAPRLRKASSHLSLLSEDEWRTLHAARTTNKESGLKQLFDSMQAEYRANDEAFFKDFTQFYNTYRQASKAYGLPLIKRHK
jgi:hypothetical protein